ncbi:MAG: hypothetical protein ACK550_02370 [Synechococcaceae cyanobacterium]
MLQLVRANRQLPTAWSFTHFFMGPENQAAVRQAAAKGLVVNASTESRSTAAALVRQGLPAVCVVPSDAPAVFHHEGVRFVACPASRRGRGGRKIQCISCGGSGPLQLRGASPSGACSGPLQSGAFLSTGPHWDRSRRRAALGADHHGHAFCCCLAVLPDRIGRCVLQTRGGSIPAARIQPQGDRADPAAAARAAAAAP